MVIGNVNNNSNSNNNIFIIIIILCFNSNHSFTFFIYYLQSSAFLMRHINCQDILTDRLEG